MAGDNNDKGSLMSSLSGLTAIANPFMQFYQNQWNANQMAQQNAWNIAQWNRENEYNTPLAQMMRLRAAGINPALAFSKGDLMNEAAASPSMQASQGRAPQFDPYVLTQMDVASAQAEDLRASAALKRSQQTYQDYMNQVEEQLSKIPIGQIVVNDGSGDCVEVVYGNAHVEFAKRDLRAIGLENQLNGLTISDIVWNLAVETGYDMSGDWKSGDMDPDTAPGYDNARSALRGDQNVREVSGRLADLSEDAAQAEKAGREAYANWLREHKDDPFVKFMLALQGFVQTFGISLPSIGGSNYGSSSVRAAGGRGRSYSSGRSWFFRPR